MTNTIPSSVAGKARFPFRAVLGALSVLASGVWAVPAGSENADRMADGAGNSPRPTSLSPAPAALPSGGVPDRGPRVAPSTRPGRRQVAQAKAGDRKGAESRIEGGSGFVAGEILDARNGAPLSGAEIRLGDRFVTTSATDGSFVLRGIPVGEHALSVNYLGYQPGSVRVVVAANQRAEASLSLQPDTDVVMLGAFQVTAELDAETRSRNRERSSASLTSILSSDALGNMPATQVAEALSRMSGISTIRTRGEADAIVIRGADPSTNSINLDGVPIQSNANDGLSVSLNTFLVDQLSTITVVKSLTPDLPADSVGGYVSLDTKSPLDFKQPVFNAHANLDRNSTRRENNPRAGVTWMTQFGARREYGLGLTASYQKRAAEAWRVESGNWALIAGPVNAGGASFSNVYIPATVEMRTNRNDRKRYGASGSFDWNVSPTTRLYLKGNFNLQKEYEPGERFREVLQATAPANFDLTKPFRVVGNNVVEATTLNRTTATVERSVTSLYQNTTSAIFKAGGRTDTGRLRLVYSAGYSRTLTQTDQVFASFVRSNVDYHYLQLTGDRPTLTPVSTTLNVNDPSIYPLATLNFTHNNKDYDLFDGKADATYAVNLGGRPVTFKSGGFLSRSSKVRDDEPTNSAATPLAGGQTLLLSDSRITLRRLPSDFLETYDLGVGPEGKSFHEFARGIFDRGQLNATTSTAGLTNDYRINQWISGGYLMGDFKVGPVATVAGARYERTEDVGRALAIGNNGALVQPIRNVRRYGFLAPSINARVSLASKLQARLGYTETMRRPSYDSAAPRTTYTINANGISVNAFNPDLKHQKSRNFDVMFDCFFSGANRVAIGGFVKEIDDTLFSFTSSTLLSEAAPEIRALFPTTSATQTVNLTRPSNGGSGRIKGLEFEYQHRFGFLPDALRGLALAANFTYVDSVWTRLQGNAVRVSRFPMQSRTTGNVALDYTRGRWYGRVSYNWRGEYLSSINNNDANLNQWGGNAESIDFKLVCQLGRRWAIECQALNLKRDADTIWLGSGLTRLRQYERSGTDYSMGVAWRH